MYIFTFRDVLDCLPSSRVNIVVAAMFSATVAQEWVRFESQHVWLSPWFAFSNVLA
jgi:hypothetical protein